MRYTIGLAIAVLWPAAALPQTIVRPHFEVASVRPARPSDAAIRVALKAQAEMQNASPSAFLPVRGATLSMPNRSFLQLIAGAYRMRLREIVSPDWMADELFNIEARLPAGASPGSAPEMLQTLLEERFALRTHRETRALSGYALTVGKDGPRLKAAPQAAQSPSMQVAKQRAEGMAGIKLKTPNASMAQVANIVAGWVQAPVVDQTGLDGSYAIELEIGPPDSPDDPMDHRVSLALAALGLKLEARKTPAQVLVVDSASKTPSEN